MTSILLVHSEYSSLSLLNVYIKKIFQQSVIYEAYTLEEAGNVSKSKNVNLILFDLDAHDEGNVTNFIERLKQHLVTDSIPIIFLTEAKEIEFYKKVSGLSGYDFIQKPIDKNMFILKLHNYSKIFTSLQMSKSGIDHSLIYSETDLKGVITKISKPFIQISGYSKEELIGSSHNILRHPKAPNSLYKNIWESITSGETWEGSITNKRKNGSSYIVKATIYPILNNNGKVLGYASAQHDITKEMIDIQKMRKTLDTQKSLTLIITNGSITYINKTFFSYFNYKGLNDFCVQHKFFSELFEDKKNNLLIPHVENDLEWSTYVKKNNGKANLVYIIDKDSREHIYDVQYHGNISVKEEMYIFTDVTHIYEQISL